MMQKLRRKKRCVPTLVSPWYPLAHLKQPHPQFLAEALGEPPEHPLNLLSGGQRAATAVPRGRARRASTCAGAGRCRLRLVGFLALATGRYRWRAAVQGSGSVQGLPQGGPLASNSSIAGTMPPKAAARGVAVAAAAAAASIEPSPVLMVPPPPGGRSSRTRFRAGCCTCGLGSSRQTCSCIAVVGAGCQCSAALGRPPRSAQGASKGE